MCYINDTDITGIPFAVCLFFAAITAVEEGYSVKVNGKHEALITPVSLQAYLEKQGYRDTRVAVERNGQIVPRAAYGETVLCDSDTLEIVSFVGGG